MSETRSPITDDRLASVMEIPVTLSIVLGEQSIPLGKLYALNRGSVIVFDKQIGEAVDILVNGRLVARGEVQVAEDGRLAVAMTEIASSG